MTRTVTIKIRRDSAADWTSTDPTLAEGEWGYETDTDKIKIGDGTTAWTALSYWTGGSAIGDVDGPSSSTDNAVTRFDGVTGKLLQDSSVLISNDGDVTIGSNGKFIATSANGETGSIWRENDNMRVNSGTGGNLLLAGHSTVILQSQTATKMEINGTSNRMYQNTDLYNGASLRIYNATESENATIFRNDNTLAINSGTGGTVTMLGSDTLSQTISKAGITTFALFPITPSAAPTTDYQTSNKKYVDDRFPSGATANAIARYDGATGKIIQNSGVTITDNGSISGTGNAGITSTGSITFVTGATSGIKQSTYTFDSYTAGDAFSARQIGYIDSIGSVSLATNQSVGSAKGRMIMALGTIAKGASGNFTKWGEVPGFTGLTRGAPYYLSNTLGSITTGSVQAAGSVSRILGYGGEATTKFDLEPSREWIVRG